MSVLLMTDQQAREFFQQELGKYFASNPVIVEQKTNEPKIVDLDGLIRLRPILGSKSTLYKKAASGDIPHSKRGKRLYFNLIEVDEWLLSNKRKTSEEIENELTNFLNKKGSAGNTPS